MKKYLFIPVVFFHLIIFAQNRKVIDSLRRELAAPMQDTSRIKTMQSQSQPDREQVWVYHWLMIL